MLFMANTFTSDLAILMGLIMLYLHVPGQKTSAVLVGATHSTHSTT